MEFQGLLYTLQGKDREQEVARLQDLRYGVERRWDGTRLPECKCRPI